MAYTKEELETAISATGGLAPAPSVVKKEGSLSSEDVADETLRQHKNKLLRTVLTLLKNQKKRVLLSKLSEVLYRDQDSVCLLWVVE